MMADFFSLEGLKSARSDAERAEWLLRAPLAVVCRDRLAIRTILVAAMDGDAIAAFDAELAAMIEARDVHGSQPESARISVHYHRALLAEKARRVSR